MDKAIGLRFAPESEERGWAELIIKTHLKDGRWHPSRLILDFANDRGVSHVTVDDVATALGVERKQAGQGAGSGDCRMAR